MGYVIDSSISIQLEIIIDSKQIKNKNTCQQQNENQFHTMQFLNIFNLQFVNGRLQLIQYQVKISSESQMSYRKYPEHKDSRKKRDRSSSSSSSSQRYKNKEHTKYQHKTNKYHKEQRPSYPNQNKNYHKSTHQQLKVNWKPPEKSKRETVKQKKHHRQKVSYSSSSKSSSSSSSSSLSRRRKSSHSSRSEKFHKKKKYDDIQIKHKQSHDKHHHQNTGYSHYKQRKEQKNSFTKPKFKDNFEPSSNPKYEKKQYERKQYGQRNNKQRQSKQFENRPSKVSKSPEDYRINNRKSYNTSQGSKKYENPPQQTFVNLHHKKNQQHQYYHQQLKKYPLQHRPHNANPSQHRSPNPSSFHFVKSPVQNFPHKQYGNTYQPMNPLLKKHSSKSYHEQENYRLQNNINKEKIQVQNKIQRKHITQHRYDKQPKYQVQTKRKFPTTDQYTFSKNIPDVKQIQKKTISRFVQTMQQAKKNLIFEPPKSTFLLLDSFRSMSRFQSETIDPEWLSHLNRDLQNYDEFKKDTLKQLSINSEKTNVYLFSKRNMTENEINLKRSVEQMKQNCTSLNELSRMITMLQVDLELDSKTYLLN